MSSKLRQALQKYKSTGNNDFFYLKNDKDTAVVRFLYGDNEDELDWYIVHETEIGGKKRWVQCPETPDCPICASGDRPVLRLFLQLLDYTDNKVKTWERGQKFIGKLLSNMERYGKLNQRKFEIERNGAAGSTQTTYELFAMDPDNPQEADLPNKQELLGPDSFIMQKTNEEMQAIVAGTFQPQQVESQREPTQQRAGYANPNQQQTNQQPIQNQQNQAINNAGNNNMVPNNQQTVQHQGFNNNGQPNNNTLPPSDNDALPEDIF